jgi:hypothetical protein
LTTRPDGPRAELVAKADGLISQHVVAPAHFGGNVRTASNDFLAHGSSREGPLTGWYMKDIVHIDRAGSLTDLRPTITGTLATVPEGVFSRLWSVGKFRFDTCTSVNGARTKLH